MGHSHITALGPGDPATWGPATGHRMDPRTDAPCPACRDSGCPKCMPETDGEQAARLADTLEEIRRLAHDDKHKPDHRAVRAEIFQICADALVGIEL